MKESHVFQAGLKFRVAEDLELLILPPILPGIIGMSHHALLLCLTFTLVSLVLPVSSKAGFI